MFWAGASTVATLLANAVAPGRSQLAIRTGLAGAEFAQDAWRVGRGRGVGRGPGRRRSATRVFALVRGDHLLCSLTGAGYLLSADAMGPASRPCGCSRSGRPAASWALPGSSPEIRMVPSGEAMTCRSPVLAVLARVAGPVDGDVVDRDLGAVEDHVGVSLARRLPQLRHTRRELPAAAGDSRRSRSPRDPAGAPRRRPLGAPAGIGTHSAAAVYGVIAANSSTLRTCTRIPDHRDFTRGCVASTVRPSRPTVPQRSTRRATSAARPAWAEGALVAAVVD